MPILGNQSNVLSSLALGFHPIHRAFNEYTKRIFYFDEIQKDLATKSKIEVSPNYNNPIVTEIKLAKEFFLAEDYHQKYIKKNKAIL